MTYHMRGQQLEGKIVGFDPETGIWYQAAAGLGDVITEAYSEKVGYAALNTATDQITKQIIEQGGGSTSDFAYYASKAGTYGGAAVCAAYGAAGAAPVCGKIGGVIAGVLAGSIGAKTTASNAYTLIDQWNNTLPAHKFAQEGILAIRGYLTQRDYLLDEVADVLKGDRKTAHIWANDWLWKKGLPPAPLDPRWKPDAGRWEMAKKTGVWAEDPNVYPPFYGYNMAGKATSCYLSNVIDSAGCGYNKLASMLGISRSQLILMTIYYMGAPTPPGSPVDWSMVGAFQIVRRDPTRYIPIPMGVGKFTYVVHPDYVKKNGTSWAQGNPIVQADFVPSQRGVELSYGLDEQAPALIKEAELYGFAAIVGKVAKIYAQEKQSKAALLRNLTILSAVGLGGWWWWKRKKR